VAHELAGIARPASIRVLAGHLHVAAQRQKADAVIGIPRRKPNQPLAKAEAEDFNPDLEQLGYSIVAELMDKHQDAQNKDKAAILSKDDCI